ncbi:MAG: sigma-54 dependent transcriptional regulator [Cyclobacteriaceae bacterium]
MEKIVIVDDDKDISTVLKRFLVKNGFDVLTTDVGDQALEWIKKDKIDLVICDFELKNYNGIELLQKIKILNHQIQVIIVTKYSSVNVAMDAVKKGVFDYVIKPLYPDEILSTIQQALKERSEKMADENKPKKRPKSLSSDYIIGSSYQSQMVQKHINLIAPTDMSVIIAGETGTGKEYVAKSIHEKSNRADKPFVAIDCGAIPQELAGSELFGHVKGAFTGAIADKKGCFERAHEGTLFLDEIGNLDYTNQVQLLRVLQEQTVRKVGGVKDISVNVRILTATNEDLKKAVKAGKFREDIFHRINEFKIEVVPLRDRLEDIETFAFHFLKMANKQLKKKVAGFEEEVMLKIQAYHWPGNLRELRNIIKRAVLMTQGELIGLSALPVEISQLENKVTYSIPLISEGHVSIGLKEIGENAEREAIIEVLKHTDYNKTKTAEMLQIDRKTLYNKMKAFDIKI